MKRFLLCAVALAALAAQPIQAQNLQPGLWEMHIHANQGDSSMGQALAQMQKEMAQMPPEQRKQMQAMLAQRGMAVDGARGGISHKVCITPEMARNDAVAPPPQQGDCKTSAPQRAGNTITMRYECREPAMKGQSTITLSSSKAYTVHSENVAQQDGKRMSSVMDMDARWLASECGGVGAPPAMPKPAR